MIAEKDSWRLSHIIEAIENIEEFAAGVDKEKFMNDYPLQCVFFRQFEVIGEAAGNLSASLTEGHLEIDWQKIKGMRNRIIHGYFEVDLDILWDTMQNDLSKLKKQIENILKEL